jgi:flagellar basal body-associated protein FliL
MKKWKKLLLIALLLIVVTSAGVYYYVFVYAKNNHRNVQNEKGVEITAEQIVQSFITNETTANTTYLNKTIQVTGTVSSVSLNQDSLVTITLQTSDVMSNVFAPYKKGNQHLQQIQALL